MQTIHLKGTLCNHCGYCLLQCAGLDTVVVLVCLSLDRLYLCLSFLLNRVYRRLSRPEEALSRCEKSLQWLKDCGKPEKTCCVYRDMAAIEQDEGHLDQAIEHLTKARTHTHTHPLVHTWSFIEMVPGFVVG